MPLYTLNAVNYDVSVGTKFNICLRGIWKDQAQKLTSGSWFNMVQGRARPNPEVCVDYTIKFQTAINFYITDLYNTVGVEGASIQFQIGDSDNALQVTSNKNGKVVFNIPINGIEPGTDRQGLFLKAITRSTDGSDSSDFALCKSQPEPGIACAESQLVNLGNVSEVVYHLNTRGNQEFFIVDKTEILFYLSKDSEKEDIAIWLNSDFFAQAFGDLFEKAVDKKDVKVIVERALRAQKADEAANRSREAAKKMASGGRDMKAIKDLPSKLTDCSNRSGELWILEGDSAAGSAKSCRDPKTQAVMPLRGKVLNTHDKELAEIIKNNEVKDIITALGAGVADQFNLYNLRYSKVIILADADSDGAHINTLILTLFIKHLPELIKKGKIYMAVPPLYRVKVGSKVHYFYSDEEMQESGVKGEITRFKGIGEMDPEELWITTMDPTKRKLIQLTTENYVETLKIFETLMGKSSAARRAFITENNLLDVSDDYFGEEVME
jgi:hypothetical protein